MRAVAVIADAIRELQQQARADSSAMDIGASSFTTPVGRATEKNEDLFRVAGWSRRVVDPRLSEGITDAAYGMRSHEGPRCLQWLQGYCCWFPMEVHVAEFVMQCLHFMDSKTGKKIPRSLEDMVQGTRPDKVLHFDYLYVGGSGPLGKDGLDEGDEFKFILFIMDGLSSFVQLEPTES